MRKIYTLVRQGKIRVNQDGKYIYKFYDKMYEGFYLNISKSILLLAIKNIFKRKLT